MWGYSKDSIRGQIEFLDAILRNETQTFEGGDLGNLDLNYYDGLLPHPLVYAIYNDCSLVVFKRLIEMGADVNEQCILTGTLPMHHAAAKGRLDLVKYLFEKKSKIDVPDHIAKRTPLHNAVEEGYLEVAKYLCEKGADVTDCDMDGFTPLHTAVEKGDIDMVEVLLCFTSNINVKNRFTEQTPLHLACLSDGRELIIKLVRRGAKPDIKDIYGVTAIQLVREHDNFILSRILEKFDVKIIEGGVDWKESIDDEEEKRVG